MTQQPVTYPMPSPSVPTPEGVALFNAGIAWLALAGFPASQPPLPVPIQGHDEQPTTP